MDIKKAIKETIRTGKIKYGTNQSIKTIENEDAELVIIAKNAPKKIKEKIKEKAKEKNTPTKQFPGTSLELGETSKRPHLISALTITDTGNIDPQEIEEKND